MTDRRHFLIFMIGISLIVLSPTLSAQTLVTAEGTVRSPLSMVRLMEQKLGAQFQVKAGKVASQASGEVVQDGRVVGNGTIISGKDPRFSYLIVPADCLKHKQFVVKSITGQTLFPIENTPVQLLSQEDNLAIVRLSPVKGALSAERALSRTSVGLFIGYTKSGAKWNTGAVTNEARTAYTGVDPATEKALVKHWHRIGLKVNDRRTGFPKVVETDLNLLPTEAGIPIFDRNGNWHGIAISRVDQHSTFVIPAGKVVHLVNRFEVAHQ